MDKSTNTPETVNNEKPSFYKSPAHVLLLLVVFLVLVCVGVYIRQKNQTAVAPTITTPTATQPTMSFTPSEKNPAQNSKVTVTLYEDSISQNVNAAQATINYPTDKLEFVSFDNSESSFEIQAQATNKNGQIVVAKGHKGNLTGRQIVIKINFKVKAVPGVATLKFADGTYLVGTADTKNILKQASDLDLNIGASQ